jgi:thioredoxin-dependent peroxiredoxin
MEEQKIPTKIIFKTRVLDESITEGNPYDWKNLNSDEIFKGKKVVIFSLPGAYTPTCSSTHLPTYEKLYDEIISTGIDEIYCLAVNDAFVMNSWGNELNIKKVKLIPDGSGEFTRLMGMLVKKDNLGFGLRSWRYSMVVNDGVIEKMFIEPGKEDNCPEDPHVISDAPTMLDYLKSK